MLVCTQETSVSCQWFALYIITIMHEKIKKKEKENCTLQPDTCCSVWRKGEKGALFIVCLAVSCFTPLSSQTWSEPTQRFRNTGIVSKTTCCCPADVGSTPFRFLLLTGGCSRDNVRPCGYTLTCPAQTRATASCLCALNKLSAAL